jgi:hypothetical protein
MIIEALKEYTDPVNHAYFYPKQFISKKEKESEHWIKSTMDYFANIAFAQYKQNVTFRKNYRLYNGEFNFEDYNNSAEIQEMIQYLSDVPEQDPEIPQHLRHYSIVTPPINQLKGELNNRPHKYKVKAIDDDAINETIDFRTNLIKDFFLQNLYASLEGQEVSEEQRMEMEQQVQNQILDYTSTAEEWGNKLLNALKYAFNFKDKSQQAFLDFEITGKQFHHFYPDNSRIGFNYKVENPSNVWYLANRNAQLTSDCWAIGTIEVLSMSEIIERYNLTGEEVEHLNERALQNLRNNEYSPLAPALPDPQDPLWQLTFENVGDFANGGIDTNVFSFNSQHAFTCITAYWQSKKRIFKRTYMDEDGYQQEMFVSEDYKMDKEAGDVSLEELWINEWWKGVKIGADIYIDVEPLEFIDRAPIIGIINTSRNTQGKSLLDLLKPYQVLYNICMNQLWELLEKEIGVVFLGDMKVVPRKDSNDPIETMLWNAKNRGTLLIDTSIENTGGAVQFNQFSRLDLTRSAEIQVRIQLAQQLRQEAYQLIGITPQRLGAVQASEAATVNNNSLQQSFAQTETWFAWHDSVMREVYQTILEIAQYIELQKPTSTLNYLNSDLENVFLRITNNELLHELFVFVSSYAEDKQTLDQLKQLAQPAMQNGAELSEMLDLFTADSERSLRRTLQDVQKRKQAILDQQNAVQQQQLQQQQEQFEMKIQVEEQRRREEAAREDMNKELDRQNRLEVEKLRGIANEGSFNPNVDTTDLLIKQTQISQQISKQNFDKSMKSKEMSLKEKELQLKEKDIDTKLQIARENKNQYDRPSNNNKKK